MNLRSYGSRLTLARITRFALALIGTWFFGFGGHKYRAGLDQSSELMIIGIFFSLLTLAASWLIGKMMFRRKQANS